MEDLIEEKEGTFDVSKAKYLPMDHTETTQFKKLSSGEYFQAPRSTGETKNLDTNEVSQLDKSTPRDRRQEFDVFLSHSGKQKNFVRQLYRDLTNQGVSCFFDEDRESLPVGEYFPSRIFDAVKTCKAGVLLLSQDFLETKWPMQELFAFVEARDKTRTNPNLKILPCFFMIPPAYLKQIKADNEKWIVFEKRKERRAEWCEALKAILPINGLTFSEGGNEVEFREQIVKEIWRKLPTASPRYHVPCMQGEARMCKEVEGFFNTVRPNAKGISIAGLYGVAGQGKTTLGKAFCNFKLKDFEGKVCHLEFSRGDSFERKKLALRYLIHCPPSQLQTLTEDEAAVQMDKRVNGQRILLVLDNITQENIDEVGHFVKADFGKNSCIILSARSLDVLVKHFKIDSQSCMRVPSLEEDEAISILLERTSVEESTLGAVDKAFALKCANRCFFKEISCRTFHPLALKAFGGHLFGKYGWNLSKWVAEIDGLVDRSGYGLGDVFAVLDKAFDDMDPKYRTIFMLLTIYILPNMSPHNVTEWLAINCNKDISFIAKAVEDLCKKAFIEEFEPEIRIHDLYIEFAQSKANEMGRWLWWKGDEPSTRGFISQDNAGFELAKLERSIYRSPSEIAPKFLQNLLVLQLVGMQNMSKLDLGRMDSLRSITLHDCKILAALDGIENLLNLAWLQIRGVDQMLKLPKLSSLVGLQHLEIDIAVSQVLNQLGDLTPCFSLREINVRCPSLLEFPRLNGLPHLMKVEFSMCDKVKGPLDCTGCVELQSIVFNSCCEMIVPPLLTGCKKLSKIVLSECDAVKACPNIDMPSALEILELQISSHVSWVPTNLESCYRLENLQLWDMGKLKVLPGFRSLSNLTVLKIGKCGIEEPPDLTDCVLLEDVYFFTLKKLRRFPNFSLLKKLKKLSLCDCRRVRDPPDINGCHQLQVFHLLYNDNLKGLSKMDKCPQLEEIKVSWHCEDEVRYEGIDTDRCQVDDDLESCLECFKDVILENLNGVSVPEELKKWMQGKTMLAKKYFRGVKLYYSVTAPYESYKSSKRYSQNFITLRLVDSKVFAFQTPGRVNEDNEDDGWLNRVREYFAGQIIARSTVDVSLPLTPKQKYLVKMWKITLTKAFSDFKLGNFDRKVCHLEFCGGRQKRALLYLTQFRNLQLEWVTSEDEAHYFCNTIVEGQRVLLILDNITENSIDGVRYYLGTGLDKNRCILLTTKSVDVVKNVNIESQSCMRIPRVEEEDAIVILVERSVENYRPFALKCANRCSFKKGRGFAPTFHRLALKAFGRHCSDFSKWAPRLGGDHLGRLFLMMHDRVSSFGALRLRKYLKWLVEIIDGVDDVFAGLCWLAIESWKREYRKDDVDLVGLTIKRKRAIKFGWRSSGKVERQRIKCRKEIKYIKEKMSSDDSVKWLAINCKKEIEEKVENLCKNAFIGDIEPEIRIHELIKELVRIKKHKGDETVCKIVECISFLLPLSPRYHVPSMQGETRISQEIVDFFNTVHVNEKGILIGGLYGMPGQGKTTVAKAFCNLNLGNFDGKVCLLQFGEVNALDRQKLVLRYLTQFPTSQLDSVTSKDDGHYFFNTFLKGQRVLLVLDNITEDSIDEVRHYLEAELGKNSCILLTARSVDVLQNFNIDSQSCMCVPRLEEEEAIAILLETMSVEESKLGAEHRGFALKCANRFSFKEDRGFAPTFHPLALKVFGRHLFSKHGSDLSKWVFELDSFADGAGDGLDDVFAVLDKAFDNVDPKYRTIFMILTRHMPPNMSSDEVVKWVALNCNEDIKYIKEAVEDLCKKAFIEEIEPEISIHDFIKEFVQIKEKGYDETGEAKFRYEIVRAISCLLPQRYHVPAMQGEARMCQKVADFFSTVHPNQKGIRIAGLYGMPGLGKTTLAKAFCNLNLGNFEGKGYHLEFFSLGHSMDGQNFKFLPKSLQGQRVLLVLDNIETEESINVVRNFLQADLGKESWILLSARSVDVLQKNFDVVCESCMSIPGLEEEEALDILLERTSLVKSELEAENRGFALQCANRCSFKQTSCHTVGGAHTFHPLALKTFGRHLFSKYHSDLSKWVAELDGLVVGSGDGLDEVFSVLDKTFDDMDPKYHTIFMLLTVYMPPNMSPHKVTEWLAVNCMEEIDFVEKAVEDLWQKGFIEEIKPEIRIQDLYMEFAQTKARKMGRWLWCKRDLITSEANAGFELAKLEDCQHQDLSQIGDDYVKNLWALQVVAADMNNLGFRSMKNIRSVTIHNCKYLEVLQGMENLPHLAWLQIGQVPNLKVLNLGSLTALQHLEINTNGPTELGDLSGCVSLREIYVRCSSLWEFPKINDLPYLEKAKFKACGEVIDPLDCRACVKLKSIVFENCWQMAHIPLIDGCSSLSKIVLNRCDQVTECSDKDESRALKILKLCISSEDGIAAAARHSECCDGLKNFTLWNIVISTDVPSLRRFSNLTVLKLYNCDICEPPDVACCSMLQDVCFFTLKHLESFPSFSSLRKLKKLCLCNCNSVRAPPDIGRCYELQVFHLLYNDNIKGLPNMDGCTLLEEIKLSWHAEEVPFHSDSYEYEDLEFCLDYQKDGIFRNINDVFMPVELKEWQWVQGKRVRVNQYFRGEKMYYSITAPCGARKQASHADTLEQVIIHGASAISDEDEVRFREKVMRAIGRLIPPRIRFPYSSMQKATTLIWLEKASTIKGIHVAGLYEAAGNEKTALCKSFYNFSLKRFEGEVSSLEFSKGNSMERLNNALKYLTCSPGLEMTPPTSEILDEDAFSKEPAFNIMILLIGYPIPDKFMDDNFMDIARDFHVNWGGNTRIVFRSQRYTIIELLRP